MAFTQVTITQDFTSADSSEPSGTVTFTPTTPMANGSLTIPAAPVTARLDGAGTISLTLAANTDPSTSPAGGYYKVDENINGIRRSYSIQIPHDQGASLTLYSLTQLAKPPAVSFPGNLGTVTSVTAGDGTVVVGGTTSNPTVRANTGTTSGTVAAGNDSRITGAAPSASPTITGTAKVNRIGYGLATATTQMPNYGLYAIDTSVAPSSGDVIGYTRDTVFTGDWTTKATVTINASGGTAAWTINGATANISPTANAATVQTALQGLSSVGSGNVTVTGGPGGSGGGTPYVVAYDPGYIATNRFQALTVNAASLTGGAGTATVTWVNNWGGDTGFLFGENAYHVTGTNSGDGNGIAYLYGALCEADQKSDGHISRLVGLAAEASFATATAGGTIDRITSLQVNAPAHKDGALQYSGTATTAYGLNVAGVQAARTFADGATTNGSPTISSATAQFSTTDLNKVVTGSGIPANSYITGLTATTITLNNNCTASATGVTVTIKGTAQATTAYTAVFGAGSVNINGQTEIDGWKDEVQLIVAANNNQTNHIQQWKYNGNVIGRVQTSGLLATGGTHIASEGLSNQSVLGNIGSVNKPGVAFGVSSDAMLYRQAAGIIGTTGAIQFGTGGATASGARLWSGSGAPNISASASGDYYLRTDTPTTANQRLYIATAANTWTGVL